MKKILVIGPTFVDITVGLKNGRKLNKISYHIGAGGKGYNIAKNIALLKQPVALATMYGQDKLGSFLERQIKKTGVGILKSNLVKCRTGIFLGANDPSGETIIDKVDTGIFDFQKIPMIDWNEIGLVIVLSSTNKKILDYLKKIKIKYKNIVFCLEIAGAKTIKDIIPYLIIFDFYISNQGEAVAFGQELGSGNNIKLFIKKIMNLGISTAVVTTGANGLICGIKVNKSTVSIKMFPAKKIIKKGASTIGAGDAITALFCSCYYKNGMTLEDSVGLAMEIAALTIKSPEATINQVPKKILNKIKKKYEI